MIAATLACAARAGEGLVTVRLGEQDTCDVTGVTVVKGRTIRFDLSTLPAKAPVERAVLRMWVAPGGREWGMGRWNDPAFDGFKVWDASSDPEAGPLAVSYPFTHAAFACHEWDVTEAAKRWAADPGANRGLKSNVPFNADPPWRRPYLQVTYEGENPDRPAQPKSIRATYRAGQVFVTWTNTPYEGAFFDAAYRIYRHTEPITAKTLAEAGFLGEVHQLSQLNYRRSNVALGRGSGSAPARPPGSIERGRINFVLDESWQENPEVAAILKELPKTNKKATRVHTGPELPDDTGVFVWTVDKPGQAYFAVTAVVEGQENRRDFGAGNALAAPVEVKVATPRPVLQGVYTITGRHPHQYREYVYWDGGTGRFHNTPSTPIFFVYDVPPRWLGARPAWGTPAHQPAWINSEVALAGYSSSVYGGMGSRDRQLNTDADYLPPTRLAPFGPAYRTNNRKWDHYGRWYFGAKATAKQPPEKRTWSGRSSGDTNNEFGYSDAINTGRDPRKSTVVPYVENRRLFEIQFVLNHFEKADPDYVSVQGQQSAWMFAMHHADKIAYVNTAQECPWNPDYAWRRHLWVFAGKKEWNLKTPDGHNAWNYNDPIWYAKKFPRKAWPFISHVWSPNYGGPGDWGQSGYPAFYLELEKTRRGGRWWWCDIGDAPAGEFLHIPRNRAYPALTNCNFCERPRETWIEEPRGSLNGYISFGTVLAESKPPEDARPPEGRPHYYRYYARNPANRRERLTIEIWGALSARQIDRPDRFEMSFRIGDHGRGMNGQSVYPTEAKFGTTDITLWRLQRFQTPPGRKVRWVNRKVRTGQVLQTGVIEPDDRGLLTVKGFFLDKDPTGNKLILAPEGGAAPAVEKTPVTVTMNRWSTKLEKLAFGEYVRRCKNPEPWPVIRGRLEAPPITWNRMTVYPVKGGGGDFASDFQSAMDKAFVIPENGGGRYRVTALAKGFYGGGWGQINLAVGGKYGKEAGWHVVDSTEFKPYVWFVDLTPGKIEFRMFNRLRYYAQGRNPAMKKQKVRVRTVIFEKLDPRHKGSNEPAMLRILSPRSATVAKGMPVRFRARAWNLFGEPVDADLSWAAEGGAIDAEGTFAAQEPGKAVVFANVAELSDGTTLTVGDAMVETFDDRSTRGWWELEDGRLVDKRDLGNWYFHPGRFHQQVVARRVRERPLALIYQAGTPWTDYRAEAKAVGRRDLRRPLGVFVRFADPANHVLFRWDRSAGTATLLVVKAGKETAAAEAATLPEAKKEPVDLVRIDVRGATVQAFLNGAAVFEKPATVAAPKAGTIGLYAGPSNRRTAFDDVKVTPLD
jgi:hypothetical protein